MTVTSEAIRSDGVVVEKSPVSNPASFFPVYFSICPVNPQRVRSHGKAGSSGLISASTIKDNFPEKSTKQCLRES